MCIVLFKVCEEEGITKDIFLVNTKRGLKPSRDLTPWIIREHYQDKEFPNMMGLEWLELRVIRIKVGR